MSQLVASTASTTTLLTVKISSSSSRIFTTRRHISPATNLLLSHPPSHISVVDLRRFNSILCRPLILMPPRSPLTFHHRSYAVAGVSDAVLLDAGASAAVLIGAYALVLVFDKLTERNVIPQKLSRKLVHILSGILFMVSWPIFSTSRWARYFASLVPLINGFRLVTHGLSLATDEGLVKSVTREGRPEELLRGPLYYVMVLIVCAIVFWRESPEGVIALSMMCGGDGIADIVGRKYGSIKLPFNQHKSWAGSISMFSFGFLISIGMLYYFSALGYFQLDWSGTVEKVALVSLVATMVESLSTTEVVDDNISVPLASMLAAYLTFNM